MELNIDDLLSGYEFIDIPDDPEAELSSGEITDDFFSVPESQDFEFDIQNLDPDGETMNFGDAPDFEEIDENFELLESIVITSPTKE